MAEAASGEDDRRDRWLRQAMRAAAGARPRYAADGARRQYQLASPRTGLVTSSWKGNGRGALAEAGRLKPNTSVSRWNSQSPRPAPSGRRFGPWPPDLPGSATHRRHAGPTARELLRYPIRGHHRERSPGDSERSPSHHLGRAGAPRPQGSRPPVAGCWTALVLSRECFRPVTGLAAEGAWNARRVAGIRNDEGYRPPLSAPAGSGHRYGTLITSAAYGRRQRDVTPAHALAPGEWSVPDLPPSSPCPPPASTTGVPRLSTPANAPPGHQETGSSPTTRTTYASYATPGAARRLLHPRPLRGGPATWTSEEGNAP